MILYTQYMEMAGIKHEQHERIRELGYYEAPASKGHHLAVPGGLVTHSKNVTRRLESLTRSMGIQWSRPESPYLVGMLHDLVKTRCYQAVNDAAQDGRPRYEYVQPSYPGHGIASAMIADELGIALTEDERVAIIYHMGLYGVGREYTDREFNEALERFPEQIIATCCADWLAARVDEENDFSE